MSPRSFKALPLIALGAALSFSGCVETSVDIRFLQTFYQEEEEPKPLGVLPSSGIVQVWGLSGGAFRPVELANRGTLLQGVNAPEPPYWYRFSGIWIFTPEPAVIWDFGVWGRNDLLASSRDASLTLSLSGLQPWQREEEAHHSLVAWGNGGSYVLTLGAEGVLADEETAELVLTEQTLEEHGAVGPLIAFKGAQGDAIHVAQLLSDRVYTPTGEALFEGDRSVSAVRSVRFQEGLDIPAYIEPDRERELHQSLVLTSETTRTLDVDVRGAAFDAILQEVGEASEEDAKRTRLLVRPDTLGGRALTTVQPGSGPYLVSAMLRTPGEADPTTARLSWAEDGRPKEPLHVVYTRGYSAYGIYLEAGVVAELGDTATLEVTPMVSAPGPVHINGEPVVAGMHVDQAASLVSWTAPATGTPTGYEVRIIRHTENVGTITEVLYTKETQLRLPPVFLGETHEDGQTFQVVVTARIEASEGFPETSQMPKAPYGFAARATPRFTAGTR